MKEEKLITSWKKIAKDWARVTKPSRPSKGDCLIYDKCIKRVLGKKKNTKVLILGATPELRDILLKYSLLYKTKVWLLDINKEMIKAMDELIVEKNSLEKYKMGNWLKMSLKNKFFHLVVGDLVLESLKTKEKETFISEVHRVLFPKGKFLVRMLLQNNQFKDLDIKKSLKKYADDFIHSKISLREAACYFWTELFHASFFEPPKGFLKMYIFNSTLKKLKREIKNPIRKLILSETLKIWRGSFENKKVWTWQRKEWTEELFERYFEIEKIMFADDYPFSRYKPIYLLKKK